MEVVKSIVAISVGASLGAVARWLLGLLLNGLSVAIPLGTLVANLSGGFLMGVAVSLFSLFPTLGPEWRLLVLTGFLGALTTFSTFSFEVWELFQQQRIAWALALIALHLLGSLMALGCGVWLTHLCLRQLS